MVTFYNPQNKQKFSVTNEKLIAIYEKNKDLEKVEEKKATTKKGE